jgi:hypothetical protein
MMPGSPEPVRTARRRPFDELTGIAFGVLVLVGFFLPGAPPKAGASASTVTAYFIRHRGALLAGDVLWGVAAVLLLWFAATLRSYLAGGVGGEDRASGAVLGAGAAGAVLLLATSAATNALAFKASELADPSLVRALYDLIVAFFSMAAFAFAAFFAATACSGARSRALPPWLTWTLLIPIALDLGGACALFTTGGAFAAGGAIGVVDGIADVLAVGLLSAFLAKTRSDDLRLPS